MTWPTVSVVTTNLDAGTDSPATARANLLDAVQKLNEFIGESASGSGFVARNGTNTMTAPLREPARVSVATAATVNLQTAASRIVSLTGTTTVTAVTLNDGQWSIGVAAGAFQLTNSASLVVQGAANYTTAAGDALLFIGEPSSVVRVLIFRSVGGGSGDVGKVEAFMRATAPAGWIKANGGTIGSASSGATNRANADTLALYSLLWAEFSNSVLPIQNSSGGADTRGASAAADFSANKRLPVFDLRAEFLRGWDDSRGVDSGRALGSAQSQDIQSHTHTGSWTGTNLVGGGGSAPGTTPANTGATGGTETRPRNVAVLYCIKL